MLCIAGLGVRWNPANSDFTTRFTAPVDTPCVMTVASAVLPESYGISYLPGSDAHVLSNAAGAMLTANADWSAVTAYNAGTKDPEHALTLAAICSRFSAFQTILLHASFVDYEGNGIIFAGPSGIGKTTQAQLWNAHLGADIVNGDKVLLRSLPEGVNACGLPWKGSSPYCLNKSAALRGIVVLRQAKENRIQKLNHLDCMEYFLPHIFLPHWDPHCVEQALDTVDQIITRVPVWLLECRPDRDAVMLTKETILR